MSEWPKEQASPDSLIGSGKETSQHRPRRSPAPSSQYGSQSIAATSTSTSQRQFPGHGRAVELPPLPQALSAAGGSFSPASRSAGVASILNPAEPDEVLGRRRKASQLESPSSSMPVLPPLFTGHYESQRISAPGTPASMHAMSALDQRPPRRILTPRSPSLHRAVSLNHLNAPSATFSAQQTPFLGSPRGRTYAIEPGTAGAPPLPTPSAGFRSSNAFYAPAPIQPAGRRASVGPAQGVRPDSASTSPTSSYSSYSQARQASPPTATSYMPTLSAAHANSAADSDHQRVPVTSSGGHNVFQMLTIETTSGTVQLPVDVQAASRVADEKRRRNAGASARFRQRRKEKEKESSTSIARLEERVKDLSEDAAFYKHERDSLVGVLLAIPGGERHFPRPQSPRLRRNTSHGRRATGGSVGFAVGQDSGMGGAEDMGHMRRRTSTISLPPPGPPQSQMAASNQGYPSSFAPSHYGHPLAPQPPLPPPHQSGSSLPSPLTRGSLPPPLMQASPQTGPWNPYAERRPPPGHSQSRDHR